MTNIDQCLIICTLKSNKAYIYAIKGTETASTKFLKVLFSWATKPEDFNCVLTLDWFPSFVKLYFHSEYNDRYLYLISSRESYSCDCEFHIKTFQHKLQYFFQLPYSENVVVEKIYKRSEQNKLNKTTCLKKMHFISHIFFNTSSQCMP